MPNRRPSSGSPFAARVKRTGTEPQSLSELDQFISRLRGLSATDEEIESVRSTWDDLDDGWTAEDRRHLARLPDDELRAELVATREEYDHATTTETEQETLDTAGFLEQQRAEAAAVITKAIGPVLEWVGEDVARAIAILELEQSESGAKRKGIVEPLTALVDGGDDGGIPVEFVGETPTNLPADQLDAALGDPG